MTKNAKNPIISVQVEPKMINMIDLRRAKSQPMLSRSTVIRHALIAYLSKSAPIVKCACKECR
jgi:metal-responsive CopG/Arc/MetJ family transcriptional regulator